MQTLTFDQAPGAGRGQVTVATAHAVPLWRLYGLRAGYLLLVLGLGPMVWPGVLNHDKAWTLMQGVVHCMLAAMSALALAGLFHPLKMLPLLFFEIAWKAIWLIVVALPLWQVHQMDADTSETAVECLMGAVFLVVVPWPYVFRTYVASPGERWR